jgi:hypothetical protein
VKTQKADYQLFIKTTKNGRFQPKIGCCSVFFDSREPVCHDISQYLTFRPSLRLAVKIRFSAKHLAKPINKRIFAD